MNEEGIRAQSGRADGPGHTVKAVNKSSCRNALIQLWFHQSSMLKIHGLELYLGFLQLLFLILFFLLCWVGSLT